MTKPGQAGVEHLLAGKHAVHITRVVLADADPSAIPLCILRCAAAKQYQHRQKRCEAERQGRKGSRAA